MSLGNVFVIDDDRALCATIGALLRYAGYSVHTWTSARAFLAAIPAVQPAVIITDVRMPEMDGLALHESVAKAGYRMPVIYISGESTLAQGLKAMKMGALDFLIKPFTRESLLQAVSAGIEKDRERLAHEARQAQINKDLQGLSPREREVYGLLRKGYSNAEIMSELQIALPTAKQYKAEVMRKLGARSLSDLLQDSPGE
jgi:two-component system, LuxR family, response regulator FixJ